MQLKVCSICQIGKKPAVVTLATERTLNFSFFEEPVTGTFSFSLNNDIAAEEVEEAPKSKKGARLLDVCDECSGIFRDLIAEFQKRMRGVEMIASKQDDDFVPKKKVDETSSEVAETEEDESDEYEDDEEDDEEEDDEEESDDDDDEEWEEADESDLQHYGKKEDPKEAEEDDGISDLFGGAEEEAKPAKPAVKPQGLKVSPNKPKPASGAPKRNGSGRIVHPYDMQDLRVWARANGYEVKDRGAPAKHIKEAYEASLNK